MKPIHWLYAAVAIAAVIALTAWAPVGATKGAMNGSNVMVMMKDGHGSGVHIGNGFVVTAGHVAADAKTMKIRFEDGQVAEAEVLWANQDYDIAVLRYKDRGQAASSALSCTVPARGDNLTAVGNPTVFEFLTMRGYVAGVQFKFGPWKEVIPLDMTIIHGMSGGGVFNANGDVVGISVGTGIMQVGFGGSWIRIGIVVPGKTVCDLMGRIA